MNRNEYFHRSAIGCTRVSLVFFSYVYNIRNCQKGQFLSVVLSVVQVSVLRSSVHGKANLDKEFLQLHSIALLSDVQAFTAVLLLFTSFFFIMYYEEIQKGSFFLLFTCQFCEFCAWHDELR